VQTKRCRASLQYLPESTASGVFSAINISAQTKLAFDWKLAIGFSPFGITAAMKAVWWEKLGISRLLPLAALLQ
jgi:hypothetical protein